MAEFETRLDRMFAEAPDFDDAGSFAGQVQSRLNRNWTRRGLVIGVFGVIGGLIGVWQIMSSGIMGRMNSLAKVTPSLASFDFGHLQGHLFAGFSPATSGAAWLGLAAAGIGAALALSRMIEDL